MTTFGKRVIASLTDFLADMKAAKPIEQHIVRRMKVKGKVVYVHDKFKAPLVKK